MARTISTETIGSSNWENYCGAYGNMSDTMEAFLNNPDDKDIAEQVYQGINHQMSFYPAAYIVLPHLADLLDQKIASGDIEWAEYCLFNIAMTIASDNIFARSKAHKTKVTYGIRDNYRRCIKKLRKTAKIFYKANKGQLTHKNESKASKLVFSGFGLPVYLVVSSI